MFHGENMFLVKKSFWLEQGFGNKFSLCLEAKNMEFA